MIDDVFARGKLSLLCYAAQQTNSPFSPRKHLISGRDFTSTISSNAAICHRICMTKDFSATIARFGVSLSVIGLAHGFETLLD
jgi:hypothetical protein